MKYLCHLAEPFDMFQSDVAVVVCLFACVSVRDGLAVHARCRRRKYVRAWVEGVRSMESKNSSARSYLRNG